MVAVDVEHLGFAKGRNTIHSVALGEQELPALSEHYVCVCVTCGVCVLHVDLQSCELANVALESSCAEESVILISGKSKACVESIDFVLGKSKACVKSIAFVLGKSKACVLRYADVKAEVGYDTVSRAWCKQGNGHAWKYTW